MNATPIAISTTIADGGEYAQAVMRAGGLPQLLDFDVAAVDERLDGCSGVLLSGGGDVDPACYDAPLGLAFEIDARRDAFELALVRRARERGIPTLCICRGLQVANVAFGGTLHNDIGADMNSVAADLHWRTIDGLSDRGLIEGHAVWIEPGSLLATIVADSSIVTGSRHHQSIATVAPQLRVVASTSDGVIEAVEARFASPFWLAVQWHPESTIALDTGESHAIFAAFVAAAAAHVKTTSRVH